MEGMKKHELLEQKMCKEIELIESKYQNNPGEMSIQDVEKLDKLYHTLKSMATYNAMKEAEEYEMDCMSGRRGSCADGRYVSRDSGESYSDGYDRGYSEAMNQMRNMGNNSGNYPHMMHYPRY